MNTLYVKPDTMLIEGDILVSQLPLVWEISAQDENVDNYGEAVVLITPEEISEIEDNIKEQMIARLWDACNTYQHDRITTLAILMLNKKEEPNTKAQAILQWVNDLWAEYKRKRDMITGMRIGQSLQEIITIPATEDTPEIEDVIDIFEFRRIGELPYSYFEAIAEE